jgi:glycosyltransferase involved in cell wall biosynthesis
MPRDAICGLALARLTGAKCIIHTHMKFGPWLGAFVPWVMKRADGIIACSRFVANSTIAAGGCASGKVHPILNSLDASLWDAETDGSKVRQEFGIAPDMPLLASIAFQAPRKGTEHLLRALALLQRRLSAFKLLVVGESIPWGQRRYADHLRALTSELGLTEHVIFTGHRADVRQILAACDLYTMPSDGEPCAVVFLEAMAMKKPIVALANGGTPEIVEHGTVGLLAPPGDIPRLAEHIQTLIGDPALRQRMGACGRQRVEQSFNPQVMAKQVEQVYQRVLHKQSSFQPALAIEDRG